jgi:hypothetical protein
MPNWTENTLKIRGNYENLRKFEADMALAITKYCSHIVDNAQVFTFNLARPMPEALISTVSPRKKTREDILTYAKSQNWSEADIQASLQYAATDEEAKRSEELKSLYGHDNWYDWRMQNWGVKWDASNSVKIYNKNTLIYEFSTPWGCPVNALDEIARKYPELKFTVICQHEGVYGKERMKLPLLEDF